MKRIQYRRYGGPEEMVLADFALPPPGADEVLVRVCAAAINPVDWKIRRGEMRLMTGRAFPRAMGTAFSGIVESVGSRASRIRPGDQVFGSVPMKRSGAFADHLITNEDLVAALPAGLPFEQAACIPVAAVTAWRGLVLSARIQAGQKVFVSGCSGAVGRAAVQIAKMHGASVAGNCGAADMEAARMLGVEPVLDYARDGLERLYGQFDAVFDTSGNLSWKDGMALLSSSRGRFLDINMDPARMLRGLLSPRYKAVMGVQTIPILGALAAAVIEGKLDFEISRTATLPDAIALITDVEQGKKGRGRAVLLMP
jgi:NADPH:quinone reductase-like Zn-dependent oxidoreductase